MSDGVEGLLVEPKDQGELATALVRLLADPAMRRRLGRAGQQKARDYRWERVASRVLTFYEEVLERRRLEPVAERPRFGRVRRAAADVANLLVR